MSTTIAADQPSFGEQLRQWRRQRHMSQLDLALDAEISSRHLSFVETGRSRPSREMVLRLAECLAIPLRGRNALLLAAGYAPVYSEKGIDTAAMETARTVISHVLKAYEPFPALAIDRHWNMIEGNRAVSALMQDVAPHLLEPPVNAVRISLHPEGVAPRIVNLPDWRAALFSRLRDQIAASGDAVLADYLEELRSYPGGESTAMAGYPYAIPLIIDTPLGRLSLLTMSSVFGSPVDVTLSEIAIESLLPADEPTLEALRKLCP